MTIREAYPAEIDLCLSIREAAFRAIVEQLQPWNHDLERTNMIRRFSEQIVWIAEQDGKPCAYFAVGQEHAQTWLYQLFVSPEFQSQGIGARILHFVVNLERTPETRIRLKVLKHNHRAIAFYERHNWTRYEENDISFFYESPPPI